MEGIRERLHCIKLSLIAAIAPAVWFCNALVVQAADVITEATTEATVTPDGGTGVTQRVTKAGNNIWATAKIVCKTATLVALIVCGLILIIGTNKMKEAVKEKFYEIAAGIAIIYLAGDICEWLEETIG